MIDIQSLQPTLGLPQGLPLVGHTQGTSPGGCPGEPQLALLNVKERQLHFELLLTLFLRGQPSLCYCSHCTCPSVNLMLHPYFTHEISYLNSSIWSRNSSPTWRDQTIFFLQFNGDHSHSGHLTVCCPCLVCFHEAKRTTSSANKNMKSCSP